MCTFVSLLLRGLNKTLVTLAYFFNSFKISEELSDVRDRKAESHLWLKLVYNNKKEEGIFGGELNICG